MDENKSEFEKDFDGMVFYCRKCISGFICSVIFSLIPLLALFSHDAQSSPLARISYCVMAIAFYIFSIILCVIGLSDEKKVAILLKTKGKELGVAGVIISTIGIIVCICLIIVSAK